VVILWLWTALLSGLALVPAYTNEGNALVPFGVMALALVLYALFFPGRHDVPSEFELEPAPPAPQAGDPDPDLEPPADVVDLESRRRGAG
jgi:UDP-GlcNAc:undecaprenyl-phosphate GlcNAc-1-phosphate transferase